MIRTSEYISQLEVTKDQLASMESAQIAIRDNAFKALNQGVLEEKLRKYSSVLSLCFFLPNPVTLAASFAALALEQPSMAKACTSLANDGIVGISEVQKYFTDNPTCKKVRVRFPFLHFNDNVKGTEYRIVQGSGVITEALYGNTWV